MIQLTDEISKMQHFTEMLWNPRKYKVQHFAILKFYVSGHIKISGYDHIKGKHICKNSTSST